MAGISAESWHSCSIATDESWLRNVVLLPVCSKDEWYCRRGWGYESKHLENMSLSLTSLSNCWHAVSTFQTSLDSRYLKTWLNQLHCQRFLRPNHKNVGSLGIKFWFSSVIDTAESTWFKDISVNSKLYGKHCKTVFQEKMLEKN